MNEAVAFLRKLYKFGPAVVLPMIEHHAGGCWSDQQLFDHIAQARHDGGDPIDDQMAVYLACTMVGMLGIELHRCPRRHSFAVSTPEGHPLEVDDVPAGTLARARMVTAVVNGDGLAARDVFIAYCNTHDDAAITQFLTDFAISISGEAKQRGLVVRR
jgi:hypothetical protein